MSIFRLIAVTLPMVVLVACGGGGGGSTAVTGMPTTTTPPPTTPPPANLETLPNFPVASELAAQTRFNGTAPARMTEAQIVTEIQTRATAADLLLFTGVRPTGLSGLRATVATPTCSNNSCSLDLPDVGALTFSLTDIADLALVDDTNLDGYNSATAAVMVDEGVTMIQSRTAARQDDGTRLTFQTYGGWLDNTVFGSEKIVITEGATSTARITSFNFGHASGTNPTGTERAVWEGVFVGHNIERDTPIQGVAEIDIDNFTSPNVDVVVSGVVDINSQSSTIASEVIRWPDMTLVRGSFSSGDGTIRGTFYGTGHTEVGGVVDNRSWVGAFGATRQ